MGIRLECMCLCECVCTHLCAQKNERLTHVFMRIFLVANFPDLALCGNFFVALNHVQSFIFLIFYGHYSFCLQIFVTQDETNQAKQE